MNRVTGADIFYIIIIVAVGIGGSGFLWYYAAEVNHLSAALPSAGQAPIVLGTSTDRGEVVDTAQYMLPSQVDALFLRYCQRPATLDELDQWSRSSIDSLAIRLRSSKGQALCQ